MYAIKFLGNAPEKMMAKFWEYNRDPVETRDSQRGRAAVTVVGRGHKYGQEVKAVGSKSGVLAVGSGSLMIAKRVISAK